MTGKSSTAFRLPLGISLCLAWLAAAGIPTQVSLGRISLSGASTILVGVISFVTSPVLLLWWADERTRRKFEGRNGLRSVVPIALLGFSMLALGELAIRPSSEGIQNVCVYLGFTSAIGLTALQAQAETAHTLFIWLGRICVGMSLLAIASSFSGIHIWDERPFALSVLLCCAALAPYRGTTISITVAPFLAAAAIGVSLSRTALVLAIVSMCALPLRGRGRYRRLQVAALFLLFTAVVGLLFFTIPELRDRFLVGDEAVKINGIPLNTSGRTQLWALTIEDTLKHPWFGQGPGSASDLINAHFVGVGHPHNDYLRLWHDFGLIGLTLYVLGFASLVFVAVRRATRAPASEQGYHWAAASSLTVVALAALTDNVIVYPFVMLPLGVICGVSEARRRLVFKSPTLANFPKTEVAQTEIA